MHNKVIAAVGNMTSNEEESEKEEVKVKPSIIINIGSL
jgi:hypothetical protein